MRASAVCVVAVHQQSEIVKFKLQFGTPTYNKNVTPKRGLKVISFFRYQASLWCAGRLKMVA